MALDQESLVRAQEGQLEKPLGLGRRLSSLPPCVLAPCLRCGDEPRWNWDHHKETPEPKLGSALADERYLDDIGACWQNQTGSQIVSLAGFHPEVSPLSTGHLKVLKQIELPDYGPPLRRSACRPPVENVM